MNKKIPTLGVACGLGAGNNGTRLASDFVRKAGVLSDFCDIQSVMRLSSDVKEERDALCALFSDLSNWVEGCVRQLEPFCVIGGDHSIAIGTWSGAKEALSANETLGLLWIDAHCDAHTDITSHSGNIHGMPVASLLGEGDPRFSLLRGKQPTILPENIILIGVRDYEKEERSFLESLGVTVFEMPEVNKIGAKKLILESINRLRDSASYYGVSFDLDALDPSLAPGVGTPVPGGMLLEDISLALRECYGDSSFLGLEVVEYNPKLDKGLKTLECLEEVIRSVFHPKGKNIIYEGGRKYHMTAGFA